MKDLCKKTLSLCLMSALVVSASAFPVNAQTLKNNNVSISNRTSDEDEVITILDPNLREALRGHLVDGIFIGDDPITKGKLAKIRTLSLADWGIKDIEGLQYCTTVEVLDLGYYGLGGGKNKKNEIESIDQLSELTELTNLNLSLNKISDISPLSKLTNLHTLELSHNKISDIRDMPTLEPNAKIKLDGQQIELESIVLDNNEFEMDNIIKLPDGADLEDFVISDISNSGSYDEETGKISFSNLSDSGTLSYSFSYPKINKNEASTDYTGTVSLDYTIKEGSTEGDGESETSKTVILASGEKYTDVLTATVLANEKDAPILLTSKDNIDEKTLAEIERLNTEYIIISGGVNSVSNKVEEQLKDYNITRIAGQDRYETAELIGNEVRKTTGNESEAMLVDGTNFPDAITVSTFASQKGAPILLTEPKTLTDSTKETLESWGINDVIIAGGYNSVSKEIEDNLGINNINRFAGADRYETAELIGNEVRKIAKSIDNMILVDGTNFPDAIAVSALSTKFEAPIMLTEPTKLNNITSNKIVEWSIENILIAGGYNSVSKDIEDNLGVSKKERVAGHDRYETAVEMSKRLSQSNIMIGDK